MNEETYQNKYYHDQIYGALQIPDGVLIKIGRLYSSQWMGRIDC